MKAKCSECQRRVCETRSQAVCKCFLSLATNQVLVGERSRRLSHGATLRTEYDLGSGDGRIIGCREEVIDGGSPRELECCSFGLGHEGLMVVCWYYYPGRWVCLLYWEQQKLILLSITLSVPSGIDSTEEIE